MPPTKRRDIGPIYQSFGAFLVVFAAGVILVQENRGERVGLHDLILLGIAVLFCTLLWRPEALDRLVKNIAHALPFFSYRKDD